MSWLQSAYTTLMDSSKGIEVPELTLDPRLKSWVLLPISIVLILVGILRQYVMVLISPGIKGTARVKMTEAQYIGKGQNLLRYGSNLSKEAFEKRREYMFEVLNDGKYAVQDKTQEGQKQEVKNPFSDPNVSDAMMNMAKGNMASYIPQTIVMWWVNYFFAGFILMKLPFPLTPKFKEMLQNGIMTADLDVRWVSAISWYFISVLGLDPIYNLIFSRKDGEAPNMASLLSMQQQQQQQQMAMSPMGGPGGVQSSAAVMKNLANDLFITRKESCFDHVEERGIKLYS